MAGNFNQSGCAPCCGGGGSDVPTFGEPCGSIITPATWTLVWSGTYQWEGWGCPAVPACTGTRNGNYYTVTDYGGSITLYQCPTNPCVWDSFQGGCGTGTNNEYHTVGNVLHQYCTSGSLDTGTNYPLRCILSIDYHQFNRAATLHIAAQVISVSIPYPDQYAQLLWHGTSGLPSGWTEFATPISLSSVNCFSGYPFHVGGGATVTPEY